LADTRLTHADWLARVPDLLAACCEGWELQLGEPYEAGAAGYAVQAERGGEPVVLKLVYPHRESEHEADALELWDGNGAVRLLERDDSAWAMLIERCEPGTKLAAEGQEAALDVLIELLPRLWVEAGDPIHRLADEAAWWAEYLPQQDWGSDRALLDAALDALRELPGTQGEQVLLHQDLHGDNVLAAQRQPWLVIDPKPLLGEREFAVAPIVRSFELGHTKRDVLYRFDRLTAELGLDRERARGWTIAQTVAWTSSSEYRSTHVESVRWLLESK
jgi:streptomycin 6-kinase